MQKLSNIPVTGWTRKAFQLPNFRVPGTTPLDIFAFVKGSDTGECGDALGFAFDKKEQKIRAVVTDGVTGHTRDDFPEPYTDPAQYASFTARDGFLAASNIPAEARRLNQVLHRDDLGALSPRTTFVSADIDFAPLFGFDASVYKTCDSKAFTYTEQHGWYEVLSQDMLAPAARVGFTALQEIYYPLFDRIREQYGQGSPQYEEAFAEFNALEQELLSESSAWNTRPIGRYPDDEFMNRNIPHDVAQSCEAILLASDGAYLSVETLREMGSPKDLSVDFVLSRRREHSDLAVAAVTRSL